MPDSSFPALVDSRRSNSPERYPGETGEATSLDLGLFGSVAFEPAMAV